MPQPAQDRLRPGQDARTATGGLTVLNPTGVTGSVLPPGIHLYTNAELVTDVDSLWLGEGATGAYVWRFPYAMSNYAEQTVTIPAPAEATRWGLAQHFWLLRGVPPGLDINVSWPDVHGYDAHSWWDERNVDYPIHDEEMIQSGHFGGAGTIDSVFIVVEVNDEHPKPPGATIDITELLAVLDTLIAAPTVFTNTTTATYIPAGESTPVTVAGYNGSMVPYTSGAMMTVEGYQFTYPITVTLDDDTVCTSVHILQYEADNQPDGYNGFIDTPGRIQFFAPPHAPAENDDDSRTVTFSTVHGDATGLQLMYVDPDQYTQVDSISPTHLDDVTDPATITITGTNFEENGLWIAVATDVQPVPGDPNWAPISFGSDSVTSLTPTEIVLAYPFTDGDTTYTLDPGMTHHIYVMGTYYRWSDTVVDLTTGGTPLPDSLYAPGDESGVTDVDDGTGTSVGTTLYFNPNADGAVTGIQYYFPAEPTGTYTGALYQITGADDTAPAGTLLGTVDFDITGVGAQWVTADFDTPIDIDPTATYRAVVYSSAGRYTKHVQGLLSGKTSARNYIQAPVTGLTRDGLGVLYNGTITAATGLSYPATATAYDYGNDIIMIGSDTYWVGVTFQPS